MISEFAYKTFCCQSDACRSPDLHAQQTTSNLQALLVAPINSYQSVLTLLAIPNYVPLLTRQLFSTRRSIAHSIISSVLKNETIIETPEDVDGVLELCHVLIKDQSDFASNQNTANGQQAHVRRQGPYFVEREEMAEEQGWVARMVHLFRAESLDIQFEVCPFASLPAFPFPHINSYYKSLVDISKLEEIECGLLTLLSSLPLSSFVGVIRTEKERWVNLPSFYSSADASWA